MLPLNSNMKPAHRTEQLNTACTHRIQNSPNCFHLSGPAAACSDCTFAKKHNLSDSSLKKALNSNKMT